MITKTRFFLVRNLIVLLLSYGHAAICQLNTSTSYVVSLQDLLTREARNSYLTSQTNPYLIVLLILLSLVIIYIRYLINPAILYLNVPFFICLFTMKFEIK